MSEMSTLLREVGSKFGTEELVGFGKFLAGPRNRLRAAAESDERVKPWLERVIRVRELLRDPDPDLALAPICKELSSLVDLLGVAVKAEGQSDLVEARLFLQIVLGALLCKAVRQEEEDGLPADLASESAVSLRPDDDDIAITALNESPGSQ